MKGAWAMDVVDSDRNTASIVRHIAAQLLAGDCRFFIGSGLPQAEASMPSTASLVLKLVKHLIETGRAPWLRDVLTPDGKSLRQGADVPLSLVAEYFALSGHRPELTHLLHRSLQDPKPTGESFKAIVSLAKKLSSVTRQSLLSIIYTTNYDLALETALGPQLSETITTSTVTLLDDRERKPVQVIHLHGAVGRPSTEYVVTERDELHELTDSHRAGILHTTLQRDLQRKTLVFVGYSLRDVFIRFTHYIVATSTDNEQVDHYAVIPSSIRTSTREAEQRNMEQAIWKMHQAIWADRKLTLIDYKSATFFKELLSSLDFHEDEVLIEELARKHGKTTDDIRRLAEDYQESFGLNSRSMALRMLAKAL